jgi:predicted transcriptional regulator
LFKGGIEIFKRRNNLEIMAEILKTAQNGVNKTKIVYDVNMNFKQMATYLNKLETLGFITREGSIQTTQKGLKYLEYFNEIIKTI